MNKETTLLLIVIAITGITLVIVAKFAQAALETKQSIDDTFQSINNVLGLK